MTGFRGLAKLDVIQTQETLSLDKGEEVGKETCVLTFLRIIWPLVHRRGKYKVNALRSQSCIHLPPVAGNSRICAQKHKTKHNNNWCVSLEAFHQSTFVLPADAHHPHAGKSCTMTPVRVSVTGLKDTQ